MSKDHLNLSFTFLISKYYNMNSILQELCTYINGARNRTKTQALKKKTTRLHATLNMNRTRYFMSSQLQECKCGSGRMFLPARSTG